MVKVCNARSYVGKFRRQSFIEELPPSFRGKDLMDATHLFKSKWTCALVPYEGEYTTHRGIGFHHPYKDWVGFEFDEVSLKEIYMIINRLPLPPDYLWMVKQSVRAYYTFSGDVLRNIDYKNPAVGFNGGWHFWNTARNYFKEYSSDGIIEELTADEIMSDENPSIIGLESMNDYLLLDIQQRADKNSMVVRTEKVSDIWDTFIAKPFIVYDCDLGCKVADPKGRYNYQYQLYNDSFCIASGQGGLIINITRIPYKLWTILTKRVENYYSAEYPHYLESYKKEISQIKDGSIISKDKGYDFYTTMFDENSPVGLKKKKTQNHLFKCGLEKDNEMIKDIQDENYVWFICNNKPHQKEWSVFFNNNITYEFEYRPPFKYAHNDNKLFLLYKIHLEYYLKSLIIKRIC
jgi:hypothetical protein